MRFEQARYISASVVPANAGTDTPCVIVLAMWRMPSAIIHGRGYGSTPSRGRPAERLYGIMDR
jgi:hypothetical protein